jgi:hypothetical protein
MGQTTFTATLIIISIIERDITDRFQRVENILPIIGQSSTARRCMTLTGMKRLAGIDKAPKSETVGSFEQAPRC